MYPRTMEPTVMHRRGSDEQLCAKVRRQLDMDRRLDADRVRVEVTEGVVHLHGVVPGELSRALALYDALLVEGVTHVVNELDVSSMP